MIQKRKFSFRHGKVSVTESPEIEEEAEGRIFLEIQGREIPVQEECLASHSRHFCRILEDIAVNSKSEFLMEQEEEEEEESALAGVAYNTVATVVDFLADTVSGLQLREDNVQDFQQVLTATTNCHVSCLRSHAMRHAM